MKHQQTADPFQCLFLLAANHNFTLALTHVPAKENVIADVLSHNQMSHLVSLAQQTDRKPTPLLSALAQQSTLTQQLQTLRNLALSSSSSRAYKSGLCHFRQFCKHLKLTALPTSKHTIALLQLSRSVAPRTARMYLAAVSVLHLRAGLQTPTQHSPSLQLVLQGMAHYHHSLINLLPSSFLTHS